MDPELRLLRSLRGAPLSVLLALRYLGRAGNADLVNATGYEHDTVTKGLRLLAGLGLVEQWGRYRGWQLAALAVQLPLFIPAQLAGDGAEDGGPGSAERECGKTALPSQEEEEVLINDNRHILTSSSSTGECEKIALECEKIALNVKTSGAGDRECEKIALNVKEPGAGDRECEKIALNVKEPGAPPARECEKIALNVKTMGAPARECGKFPLPPELQAAAARLAEMIVERRTCPRNRALPAVAAALARGQAPEHVELQILTWDSWLRVEANRKGLRAPGLFLAAKILNGEPAPRDVGIAWDDQRRAGELQRVLAGEAPEAAADDGAAAVDAGEDQEPDAPGGDPPPAAPQDLWDLARAQLRLQLPRSTYETWVRDTVLLAHREDPAAGDQFVVQVGNAYARDWLTLRLRPLVVRTLRGITGRPAEVVFEVAGDHDS